MTKKLFGGFEKKKTGFNWGKIEEMESTFFKCFCLQKSLGGEGKLKFAAFFGSSLVIIFFLEPRLFMFTVDNFFFQSGSARACELNLYLFHPTAYQACTSGFNPTYLEGTEHASKCLHS